MVNALKWGYPMQFLPILHWEQFGATNGVPQATDRYTPKQSSTLSVGKYLSGGAPHVVEKYQLLGNTYQQSSVLH